MADIDFSGSIFMKGGNAKGGFVSFSDPKGIVALGVNIDRKSTPEVPGADAEDIQTVLIAAQDAASKKMAQTAARRMRGFFNPANKKFYVGMGSEKTARGISVSNTPQGSPGAVLYVIRERRRSLRLIRQGLLKGAKGPHSRSFFEWMDEQEIENVGADRKTAEATRESTKFRIANYIYRHGMSDYWAANIPAADGHRFFNYPQYYNRNYASPDAESAIRKMDKGEKSGLRVAITSVALGVLSSAHFQTSGTQKVNTRTYEKGKRGRALKRSDIKIMDDEPDDAPITRGGGNTAIESGTWTYEERKRRRAEMAAKYNNRK